MGEARIVTNNGSGRYTVQPVYKIDNAKAVLANLKVEKSTLEDSIQPLITEITYQKGLLNILVDDAVADAGDGEFSGDHLEQISEKRKLIDKAELQLASVKVRLRSVEREIDKYSALIDPSPVSAWCSDFSENLNGTIETIERGRQSPMIIAPGGQGGSGGHLKPVKVMTPAQAFLNYAMLPGANKWRAHYAVATLSNIDDETNTCTVTLQATTSSHQNLPGVIGKSVDSVPINYMHCHAKAFSNGDMALVTLAGDADQTVVEVIGFPESPKVCPVEIFGPQSCDNGSVYFALGGKAPYVWNITADEPETSGVPVFEATINPETGLNDGSAIEIVDASGCCGSGVVDVSAALGGTDEKSVRFPVGAWRATHFEWSHLGVVNYTENTSCCNQAIMDAKVGTFWERLCDFDTPDPCSSPANLNAGLQSEECCGIFYSAQTQVKRVDEHASLANAKPIEYSDGAIAYVEYGVNLQPVENGYEGAEYSAHENCPQWIKDLPTSSERRAAATACLYGSTDIPTPLNRVDIDLPAGEAINDYEIAIPANDPPEEMRIVGREFFVWQCNELVGESTQTAFVFSGISPL